MKFLVFGAGVFSGGARGRDWLVMVGGRGDSGVPGAIVLAC